MGARVETRVETKVQAGTLSAVVGGIAVWALQTYVFKGNISPGLVSLIYAAVPGVLALAGGYLAPHSPRPLPPVTRTLPGNDTVTKPPPPSATGAGQGSGPGTGA